LDAFLKLAAAPPEKIVDFVRRWGILSVCAHGRPSSHLPTCRPLGSSEGGSVSWSGWEPLHSWYFYARQARAMLGVLIDLRLGDMPKETDWRAIIGGPLGYANMMPADYDLLDHDPELGMFRSIDGHRQVLANYVTSWLDMAGLHPEMHWDPDAEGPQIVLVPTWGGLSDMAPTLFGILAAQLAAAIASPGGLYYCTECGVPFRPQRKPRYDRDAYCHQCSAMGAAAKNWAKRHREIKTATRSSVAPPSGSHAAGSSTPDHQVDHKAHGRLRSTADGDGRTAGTTR